MELAQSRIVTDDVARLAGFYASLLGVPAALNDYYVEVQAGPASVGFSRRRFTEYGDCGGQRPSGSRCRDEIILDFLVDDVDAEYRRIAALGVEWVMPPTTQPWGNRSMIFRDPGGNLVNVFSHQPALRNGIAAWTLLANFGDAVLELRIGGEPAVALDMVRGQGIGADDAIVIGGTITIPLHGMPPPRAVELVHALLFAVVIAPALASIIAAPTPRPPT